MTALSIVCRQHMIFRLELFKVFWGVYYMHLKIKNCYLKICMKIRVNKKVYRNMCNIV